MRLWTRYTILTAICLSLWQNFGDLSVNGHRVQNSGLKLRTSIVTERHCYNGGETLRIHLRLLYQNSTDQKLILYKGSSLVSQYLVSRTVRAATKKHYVEVVRNEITFPSESEPVDSASPGEPFALIEPGKSFTTEAEVDIPVRDKSDPESGFLDPGRYVLQIVISTWLQSPDLALRLKRRWRRFGRLWYRPVVSLPMSFIVRRERLAVKCE